MVQLRLNSGGYYAHAQDLNNTIISVPVKIQLNL